MHSPNVLKPIIVCTFLSCTKHPSTAFIHSLCIILSQYIRWFFSLFLFGSFRMNSLTMTCTEYTRVVQLLLTWLIKIQRIPRRCFTRWGCSVFSTKCQRCPLLSLQVWISCYVPWNLRSNSMISRTLNLTKRVKRMLFYLAILALRKITCFAFLCFFSPNDKGYCALCLRLLMMRYAAEAKGTRANTHTHKVRC